MRGHLRIRAERSPYRRAGLIFGESRELEVFALDLDGERLLALAADPAVQVAAWDGHSYRPIGDILAGKSADELQQLLDQVGADQADSGAELSGEGDSDLRLRLATSTSELAAARADLERTKAANLALESGIEVKARRIGELEAALADAGAADAAELARRLSNLADFIEAREGFERRDDEAPEEAAMRLIVELDEALAAAPPASLALAQAAPAEALAAATPVTKPAPVEVAPAALKGEPKNGAAKKATTKK